MIETLHPPGPWGVEQTSCSNWIGRLRPDGTKVDHIVAHTDRDSLRSDVLVRNDANARLIAAAPEMLAALKMVLQFGRIDDSVSRMEHVASVIAKAEVA